MDSYDILDLFGIWFRLVAAAAAAFWTSLHPLYQALVLLIVIDILTGSLASIASGTKLSSDISYRGLVKKSMKIIMVATATILEPYVGLPLGAPVAGWWCADELLSIIENYGKAGLPLPTVMRVVLERLSEQYAQEAKDRNDRNGGSNSSQNKSG